MAASIYYLLMCHSTKYLTQNIAFNPHNTTQGWHSCCSQEPEAQGGNTNPGSPTPELVSFEI